VIPLFDAAGNLPPGIHWADWPEFAGRFGSTLHRQQLLAGLVGALDSLHTAGCRAVYIDGSFVTSKEVPGDYDGCWSIQNVDPALLDPVLLDFSNSRAAQKARYGGELFPAELPEGMTGTIWFDFFQRDKDGNPKGIVALDTSAWTPGQLGSLSSRNKV
jgi:hypothetical protein